MPVSLADGTEIRAVGRDKILVRKYERPDRYGSLFLPGADRRTAGYARDNSGSLWEYVMCGADVEESLGFRFEPDANYILQTEMYSGVAAGDGEHFFLAADSITGVHPYDTDS